MPLAICMDLFAMQSFALNNLTMYLNLESSRIMRPELALATTVIFPDFPMVCAPGDCI